MTEHSELHDRYLEKVEEWRDAARVLRRKDSELAMIEAEMDD